MKVTVDEIKLPAWKFRIWSHPIGVRRTILHASCVIEVDPKRESGCVIEILNLATPNEISMREVRARLQIEVEKLGFLYYASNRSYQAQMINRKV